MKLRVLILKKRTVYYTLLSAVSVLIIIIFFVCRSSSATFSIKSENLIKKADLTGDGKEDILYIKVNDSDYSIQISTEDRSIVLEPDKGMKKLGTFCSYWPMHITLLDITKDGVPEIFTQASSDGLPVIHVFKWTGDGFKDIYYSECNILGFTDSRNNRTPKVIAGNMKDSKIALENYYFSDNNLQKFEYTVKNNTAGENTISSFVKIIEHLPQVEDDKYCDLFSPKININNVSAVKKLIDEKNKYTFEDAVFKDTKWNKSGEITEIQWTLNFKGVSLSDEKSIKNYSLLMALIPQKSNGTVNFKIYTVKFI